MSSGLLVEGEDVGGIFFVRSHYEFLHTELRRWIVGGKKTMNASQLAEMASGFLIFDDLNNGQLPANLRTLLS